MRFMIIRKADKQTEALVFPSKELMVAMGKYMEDMHKAGILLSGEGLQPTSKGVRVKFAGGKPTVKDGPFTEAKELIAGYTIIDVPSKDEAVAWAKRWPSFDMDANVELEIRPLFQATDFPADLLPPEEVAKVQARRDEVAKKAAKP
jgi:hypothetical protein